MNDFESEPSSAETHIVDPLDAYAPPAITASAPVAHRLDAESQRVERELRPPVGLLAASICGVVSAFMYTAANIALRYSVGIDPFLVAAVKAVPTVVCLLPFLIWMWATNRTLLTSTKWVRRFMLAALLGQFIGNGAFQVSLEYVGLAVAVPICLGVLIIGGAILGKIILGEVVGMVKSIAIVTLILAVIVLSIPSESGATLREFSPSGFLWGAFCAAASGAAYSFFGVTMRQAMTGGLSAPATMFISGCVGMLSLWSFSLARLGWEPFTQVTSEQWITMVTAGVCNFTAFVALSTSLKALPVVAVNLINASQVAMAAIAGVLLFAEPVTGTLTLGILLTLAGLAILATTRKRK